MYSTFKEFFTLALPLAVICNRTVSIIETDFRGAVRHAASLPFIAKGTVAHVRPIQVDAVTSVEASIVLFTFINFNLAPVT